MKKKIMLVVSCLFVSCVMVSPAISFDILALHDNLYIKSIDSLRITNSPDPVIRIIMTLQNDTDKTVRVKNGKFRVYINPNPNYEEDAIHQKLGGAYEILPKHRLKLGSSKIAFGSEERSYVVTQLSNFEIAKGVSKSAIFEIPLSNKTLKDRYRLVLRLINYIGLPGSFSNIEMVGAATVGIKGTRGWAYQDLSLLELNYIPKLQSEVLFK